MEQYALLAAIRHAEPDSEEAAVAQAKYRQIAQDLLEQIRSGAVRPGDQLPSELELGEKYSASRNTIRDAVKWLTLRGLVEAKPGQGTFAAQRVQPFVTTLSEGNGWLSEVSNRGGTAMVTVPQVGIRSAPRYIADRLHVPEGAQVITRRQERYIDRTPSSVQTTAYSMDLVRQGATRLLDAENITEGTVAYLGERLGLRQVGRANHTNRHHGLLPRDQRRDRLENAIVGALAAPLAMRVRITVEAGEDEIDVLEDLRTPVVEQQVRVEGDVEVPGLGLVHQRTQVLSDQRLASDEAEAADAEGAQAVEEPPHLVHL